MTCTISQSRYMYTDSQIHYDITLVLDMHARPRYYKIQSTTVLTYISATQAYDYTDTVVHYTWCSPLHMIVDTDHCYYLYMLHRYYDTAHMLFCRHGPPIRNGPISRNTVMSCIVILGTWILGISLHGLLHFILAWNILQWHMPVLFLSSCHMDHHAYYMYYLSLIHIWRCRRRG